MLGQVKGDPLSEHFHNDVGPDKINVYASFISLEVKDFLGTWYPKIFIVAVL